MATEKQIEANRKNAKHSTGPKTPEGKRVCRGNAVKHGLAGDGVVLPPALEAEARRLEEGFAADLRPAGELERALVRQMARACARMDASAEAESARINERRRDAVRDWD